MNVAGEVQMNTTAFHFQATSVPQINGIKLNYNNMYENINFNY